LVPTEKGATKFVYRASKLATALYLGLPFLFDEMNRVPEKALAPLSSLLDGRKELYSTMANVTIRPKDETAARRFRFCCALNPGVSDASSGVLPEYIEQRTRPAIPLGVLELPHLLQVLEKNLRVPKEMAAAFERWYKETSQRSLSVRQVKTLVAYAEAYARRLGVSEEDALRMVATSVGALVKNEASDGSEVGANSREKRKK
jgi:hypothetical protein